MTSHTPGPRAWVSSLVVPGVAILLVGSAAIWECHPQASAPTVGSDACSHAVPVPTACEQASEEIERELALCKVGLAHAQQRVHETTWKIHGGFYWEARRRFCESEDARESRRECQENREVYGHPLPIDDLLCSDLEDYCPGHELPTGDE